MLVIHFLVANARPNHECRIAPSRASAERGRSPPRMVGASGYRDRRLRPLEKHCPNHRPLPAGQCEELLGRAGRRGSGDHGGFNLAGGRGAIIMQDNGFGNALTALATWAVAYHVPLPILANTRGGLGEYNSMIHHFSEAVPELLRSIRIPVFHLDRRDSPADWETSAEETVSHAWMTDRLSSSSWISGGTLPMRRIDAIRVAVELTAHSPVVANCAATSRELAAVADRPNHLYLLDSMGLATSVAFGCRYGLPHLKVVALEGDGALLMNLGSLSSIGYLSPPGPVILLLDNGLLRLDGGSPHPSRAGESGEVARACGLRTSSVADPEGLRRAMEGALDQEGPHLVHAKIECGNEAGHPAPTQGPRRDRSPFSVMART